MTGDKVLALEKSRELSGGSGHNCVSTDPMNSSLGTLPYSLSAQKESSEKMPCWNFSHEGMKVSKINWNYALELLVHLPVSHALSYARIFALVNFTPIWPYHL